MVSRVDLLVHSHLCKMKEEQPHSKTFELHTYIKAAFVYLGGISYVLYNKAHSYTEVTEQDTMVNSHQLTW